MQIKLIFSSPLFDRALSDKLSRVVRESALELESDIKLVLFQGNQNASGKTVRKGKITKAATAATRALGLKHFTTAKGKERAITAYKFHRQSVKGQAPATDTGGLIGFIASKNLSDTKSRVSIGKNYGSILDDPSKLNRPFFKVTVAKFKPKFMKRLADALKG